MRITNWAGNVTFTADRLHAPSTVDELRDLVTTADRIRPLGTRHSFSRIADTPGELVSLADLPLTMEVDPAASTVRVAAAVRYGDLATHLHGAGYAVANLGSLPHISIAGACATGTHGSGIGNGNLSTVVAGLELVRADGELVRLARGDADLAGSVVGLGALGVVTHLTLDVQPTFDVRQYIYDDLPRAEFHRHWAEVLGAAYSVSLFLDWTGPVVNQVWLKRRVGVDSGEPPASWLGATLAREPRHPVPGMPVGNCTEQLGVPGPWHLRLPHFRLEFTPSSGEELQSEYFVPRDRVVEALTALDPLRERLAPVVQISEIRTVAADDLWLSPAYGRDSVAVHFTWISDAAAVAPVVAAVEERLAPLGARPHWGKIFTLAPETVAAAYPRLADFAALRHRVDPGGKFVNEMVERYIG